MGESSKYERAEWKATAILNDLVRPDRLKHAPLRRGRAALL
jgi:hypothetical protein